MDLFLETVKEFFEIEKGITIIDPNRKIKIIDIENTPIFISRKSVKHFTESRKDLLLRFIDKDRLRIILGITNDSYKVLKNPDKIYNNPKRKDSFIYIKKIKNKTPISIIIEKIDDSFEIVSIHPVKENKYKKILNK